MHNNKSPGPDGWPISTIKSVGGFIAIPLSIIFNKSFNSGTLPHDWKNAQVTPVHKEGARNNVSHYCPVSLTSIYGPNKLFNIQQFALRLSIWICTWQIMY